MICSLTEILTLSEGLRHLGYDQFVTVLYSSSSMQSISVSSSNILWLLKAALKETLARKGVNFWSNHKECNFQKLSMYCNGQTWTQVCKNDWGKTWILVKSMKWLSANAPCNHKLRYEVNCKYYWFMIEISQKIVRTSVPLEMMFVCTTKHFIINMHSGVFLDTNHCHYVNIYIATVTQKNIVRCITKVPECIWSYK